MANLHISATTEIGNTEITLNDIANRHYKKNYFETYTLYTNDGRAGWYKVLHIRAIEPGNYGTVCGVFIVHPGIGDSGGGGIIFFNYYNGSNIYLYRWAGNLFTDNMFAIQNDDYSIDIYLYEEYWYRPVYITMLEYFSSWGDISSVKEGVGWISSSKPSGGRRSVNLIAV